MKLAPWVSNQSSNLIKVNNTLEKTSHQPRSKRKLKKVTDDLKISLEEDKLSFEKELFGSDIQNYLLLKCILRIQAFEGLDTAQLFNKYFLSVFPKIGYKRNISERNLQRQHEVHFSEHNSKDVPEQLDTMKAKGADGLGNVFVKRMANVFFQVVLFNTSAKKHVFPDVWKTAEAVPTYKSQDKQDISN